MLKTRQRLGEEVGYIDVASHVNDAKLTLADTVLKPVEPHVDAFRHAGGHRLVGESDSTLAVAINESGLLGVAEVVRDTAFRVGDLQSRTQTRVLRLLDCRADHRDEGGVAGQGPVDEVQRVVVEPGVRGEAEKVEGAGDGARASIDTITGIHTIMLGYTYINQQYYSTVGISMYDSILYYSSSTVRYITSISYNTNTGNTLCNAPDLFDLWSPFPLSSFIILIATNVSFYIID